MRTELIEAAVFVCLHVDVTVLLLVLPEVIDPLVERPRDVFLRHPIKAESIKPRYVLVGQLLRLALAGIFTRVPRSGAELGEGSVLGNGHVGMAMRLLEPLQVLDSIVECLDLASRLWCLPLLLILSLPSLLLLFFFRCRACSSISTKALLSPPVAASIISFLFAAVAAVAATAAF